MKIIKKRALLFTCLLCVPLFFTSIHAMENTFEFGKYTKRCNKVDGQQEQKLLLLCNSVVPALSSQEIDRFNNKLQHIRATVEPRHDALFEAIKREHNIDEDSWQGVLNVMRAVKEFERIEQHKSLSSVTHDKAMPRAMEYMLKSLLVQNGIHPKRIELRYCPENEETFTVRCPIPVWKIKYNGTLVLKSGKAHAGKIYLYAPKLPKKQEALCMIVVEIIKQGYDINADTLLSLCKNCFDLDHKAIEQSLSFKKYIASFSPIASLLLALQSQKNADIMHGYYSSSAATFDMAEALQHYTLCAKIRRYWNSIEWLQQYASPERLIMPKETEDKAKQHCI